MKGKVVRRVYAEKGSSSCTYCGGRFTPKNPRSLDHIVSKAKGGRSTFDNLTPACLRCNTTKGALNAVGYLYGEPWVRRVSVERVIVLRVCPSCCLLVKEEFFRCPPTKKDLAQACVRCRHKQTQQEKV